MNVEKFIYSESSKEALASIKIGYVPFKPGILLISSSLRMVPFSVIVGRWRKLIKLVSLWVILMIVPVSGNVLRMSAAFLIVPKSIGAMPVNI